MPVPIAYLGVILIWSTTPLAIKWSNDGGYLFAVTARMILGVLSAMLVAVAIRNPLALDRRSIQVYLISGASIYLSMGGIYWSAQYIPSGWISVIFGLAPLITGVLAALILNERGLGLEKILGMLLGVAGLVTMFSSSLELSVEAAIAVAVSVVAVAVHSASSVCIKRIGARATGLATSIGGIFVSIPFFLITGALQGIDWTPQISNRALGAIFYLSVVGCALGFSLYYFILKHVSATRVSLITMITPVCALLLGSWLNGEPVVLRVWLGTLFIAAGLISFELEAGRGLVKRLRLK